jgi:hypothetical protein
MQALGPSANGFTAVQIETSRGRRALQIVGQFAKAPAPANPYR